MKSMKLPKGKALTDAVWGILGVAMTVWLVVDAGMWDDIPIFWKGIVLLVAIYEAYTLVNKDEDDTLSEGIWRYTPSRPIVGFVWGVMSLYLFPKPQPRDIWYLLMGHFIFTQKQPTDEEIFKLALQRYNKLKRTMKKYDALDKDDIDGVARELVVIQAEREETV
jgi:hypothetical protein